MTLTRARTMLLLATAAGALGCSERVQPLTRSWEKAFPAQAVPEGLQTLRAADCGRCHVDIYEEWKSTTHAKAMADQQFIVEWKKDDNLFLCRNCHAPLINQQDTIVEGLIGGDLHRPVMHPNPGFDPVLRDEAITCAVCHVRDGAVVGPYGDQETAPHKVRKRGPGELSQVLCSGCHQQEANLGGTLICTFTTENEWNDSPYPAQGASCITCHMPEVQRKNAPTSAVRPSNHHTWPGAGIAKFKEDAERVRKNFVSGLDVAVHPEKTSYAPGETANVEVVVKNQRAGHMLPTGDVERHITVTMQFVGPSGDVLSEREERIGQLWEWYPAAKRVSDNRLKPLEARSYRLAYAIPANATDVKFRVIIKNNRMTDATAKVQNLFETYPLRIEVSGQEYPITSPTQP